MSTLTNVLFNFATNFVVAFVVVALLRDRSAGVKAGLVFGAVGAVAAWLLSDRAADLDLTEMEFADPEDVPASA
jgi:hypothetical protein